MRRRPEVTRRGKVAAISVAILLCALGAAPLVAQETDEAKEERVRELLQLTGAGEMGVQVMRQMIAAFKAGSPDVPEEFWDGFMAEINPDELVELVVPIYLEHLTLEEISAAIEFYQTPAGQSLLKKMPIIMQDSMAAGQQWGAELGQSVVERLEKWKTENPKT